MGVRLMALATDPRDTLIAAQAAALALAEKALEKEREACAKVAEDHAIYDISPTGHGRGMSRGIAAAIRARKDQLRGERP
jgi:hypothetical protein